MKVQNVIVEIKPTKEALKEFAEVFGKVKRGEAVKPKRSIGFSNVEGFRKFFSERRMQLLSVIKHHKPRSIYHLAQLTKRQYKNVYDDVKLLEDLGLVNQEKQRLSVDFTKLNVELKV